MRLSGDDLSFFDKIFAMSSAPIARKGALQSARMNGSSPLTRWPELQEGGMVTPDRKRVRFEA